MAQEIRVLNVEVILDSDARKTIANANIAISEVLKALAEFQEEVDEDDKAANLLTIAAHINSTTALLVSLPKSKDFYDLVRFTSKQATEAIKNLDDFKSLPIGSSSVTLTVIQEEED
jgi:hypothetical protein